MAKFKRQTSMVIKRDGQDVYHFKNGVAIVPGCKWQRKPMQITLAEFNEAVAEGVDRVTKELYFVEK